MAVGVEMLGVAKPMAMVEAMAMGEVVLEAAQLMAIGLALPGVPHPAADMELLTLHQVLVVVVPHLPSRSPLEVSCDQELAFRSALWNYYTSQHCKFE